MSNKMEMSCVQTLTFSSVMLFAQSIATAAQAQMPYDGNWNATVETTTGNCDQVAHFHLSVLDGRVSGPEDAPAESGKRAR